MPQTRRAGRRCGDGSIPENGRIVCQVSEERITLCSIDKKNAG